jgi:hypothetical protein
VPDPDRMVRAGDILAATDVRRLCGISHGDRHTLKRWRATRAFPDPVRVIRQRKGTALELWDRRDVKTWLKANPPVN